MPEFSFNEVYSPVFSSKARYKHIHGGRGRGGSHFGTDYFLFMMTQPGYFRGYFLREIFGDIRHSLWQDFKDRIESNDTLRSEDFQIVENEMRAVYLPTGNTVQSKGFKKSSGKSTAKLKSIAGATHVLIEESEEIDESDFNQLDTSLRTTKADRIEVMMIFNPPHKDHWIIKKWYNLIPFSEQEIKENKDLEAYFRYEPKNDPGLCSVYSTYHDNRSNVDDTFATLLEAYRETNPDYYYTMVKGYVSEGMKGVIYKDWKPISNKEYQELPYKEFFGLDFGFSDPVAMPACKHHNGKLYIKEMLYQPGLTNPQLSERFTALGINKGARIVADSAEPKSIRELRIMRWNVQPAIKGKDSIKFGIKTLMKMEVYYVETGRNLIHEKNHYRWALDADKNPTDTPEDKNNHLMDAIRYAVTRELKP